MARHPIENDPDAGLVKAIHQIAKLIRVAKARSRRKIARHLISPGTFEWMLRYGEQFDMGIAHFEHVGEQGVSEFAITKKAISFVRLPLPGAKVDFIDADGRAMPLLGGSFFHPVLIAPGIAIEIENKRRGGRSVLAEKSEGIALGSHHPVAIPNLEFVVLAFSDVRNEDFPDAAADQPAHRMAAAVPAI